MIFPENLFTDRQFMINPDFELYHYKNFEVLNIPFHHHDFNEIYILLSGDVEYYIEGIKYNLIPGDILLINSQELHRPEIKPGKPYERIVLFIRPEFIISHNMDGTNLLTCFESNYEGYNHLLHPENKMLNIIKQILIKLFTILNSASFGSNILKELYITEFLVHINQCFLNNLQKKGVTIAQDKLIKAVINYVNKNINNELSLDRIARELFISKYHLSHYFKLHMKISLHKFIKYKRLLMARSLLKEGFTVTDACLECGFGDYNNFIRSFKKLYGLPPKRFSKNNLHSNCLNKIE